MRSIKKVHKANYNPIADLTTYTPLPSYGLDQIDPFLLLNHHGPQIYTSPNRGLPFGPHPHRGMETITFIFDGDIMHKDSAGNESVIFPGGVQYMSAGKGLIHAEQSSSEFKQHGGDLEILQMWLNLAAKNKMNEPFYHNFQKEDIPVLNENGVDIQLIAGEWKGIKAAFETSTDLKMATLYLQKGSKLICNVAKERNVFFYVVRGEVNVNGTVARKLNLVEFNNDAEEIIIESNDQSLVIFGHALPLNEPVVSRGPFVMNTEAEIAQAYKDYQNGLFGVWRF
jgi:quercetin 2,3-dioxygenase